MSSILGLSSWQNTAHTEIRYKETTGLGWIITKSVLYTLEHYQNENIYMSQTKRVTWGWRYGQPQYINGTHGVYVTAYGTCIK